MTQPNATGADRPGAAAAPAFDRGAIAMPAFSSPRRPGRRLGSLAAPFAWLLVFATLLLLAFVAAPPRLAGEPPLFWIGEVRPLPSPLGPSLGPGHGQSAPSIRESQL